MISPRDKAIELVDKFGNVGIYISIEPRDLDISLSQTTDSLITKQELALITVDEILEIETPGYPAQFEYDEFLNFWQQVKQEILNL